MILSTSCSLGLLSALFLLTATDRGAAQEHTLQQYVVSRWGMEEGLPQSSVNDILQTRDGYLWLATFGGLVRFDGASFTTFDRFNTKGMRSDRILTLYEDRQDALWLGTENGFLRYQNGECSTFVISQESQIYSPLKVAEDARGVMWLSVNAKPYRYGNGTFIPVPVIKDPLLAAEAVRNPNGTWLAHEKELLRTLGDSIVQIMDLRSVLNDNIKDFIEFPAGSGRYFIGTSGDGVVQYMNGKFSFLSEKDGLASKYVWKFYHDRNNKLWVICYAGQSVWNGTAFVPFKAITSPRDVAITGLCEDTEGNYWIGTQSSGLYKIRPSIISTIGEDEGLLNEKMLSLFRRGNGTVLFATNCGGIYEWKNNKSVYSTVNAFLPNLCVWSIFEDSKKNIWFGSRVLYRSSTLTTPGVVFDSTHGFYGVDIFAMTEDSHHNIWIGCLNGVFVYDGKQFRRYGTADGLSYNDTRAFFEDREGTMWIGTTNGLNRFRNGTITQVPLPERRNDSLLTSTPYIRAIHQDQDGTMWFGSYGNGLIRMKDGKISFITKEHGLFDNIVSHIVEDARGNFWMGCNRGIFRVHKEELNGFCDGRIKQVRSFSYGTADGMKSAETNGGFQPSYMYDGSEKIFFPTVAGVAVVSTRELKHNTSPPPVRIESVILEGNSIPASNGLTLLHDSTYLEIRYTALSYTEPKKVRFRYMVEGLTESWTDAGDRRSAIFSRIPPGEFTFRVIASNNDGVWNTDGASLRITVLPPFWMTWWFRTLVVLFFLSAGPSVYYVRVTQLKKEKMRQQMFSERLIDSQEQERRRIAMELHDGLGQQILVVKNRAELALHRVTDPVKTAEQLREIVQGAVSSINDIRAITHGLRPVHLEQFGLTETVKNLYEQLKQSSSIEWVCHVDDIDGVIPREKEINFYRILQEGTNNILRYSHATQASIMIRRSDREVTASVWDNGKGFDPEQKSDSAGIGLSGIKERANTLGGTCEITSQPDQGTSIMIIIPVKHNG